MSEQESKGFMQQLEAWANELIIAPLLEKGPVVIPDVHEAIRAKVLESYRNGQAAGPRAGNWRSPWELTSTFSR
jgi:hypothetical protein